MFLGMGYEVSKAAARSRAAPSSILTLLLVDQTLLSVC